MEFNYTVKLDEDDRGTAGFNDLGDLLRYIRMLIEEEQGDYEFIKIEVTEK